MKKSISLVAIVALFAVGTAFTTKYQSVWWSINNPVAGKTPGYYNLTADQVKNIFCPGVDNVECAYLVSNSAIIIKKPY